jgi:hypothetical protein
MRTAARRRVLERYALADLLPRHLQLIRHLAGSAEPVEVTETTKLELAATA